MYDNIFHFFTLCLPFPQISTCQSGYMMHRSFSSFSLHQHWLVPRNEESWVTLFIITIGVQSAILKSPHDIIHSGTLYASSGKRNDCGRQHWRGCEYCSQRCTPWETFNNNKKSLNNVWPKCCLDFFRAKFNSIKRFIKCKTLFFRLG